MKRILLRRLKPTAGIRFQLILVFFGISLLVALIAVFAISEQLDSADTAAILEAEHLATALAYTNIDDVVNKNTKYLQNYVDGLNRIYHQDVTVVDLNKIRIADSDVKDAGNAYQHDMNNEVGQTLKDGQPRHFTEVSPLFPSGTKEIVVPIRKEHANADSSIIGAVILEYSTIYEELLNIANAKIRLIALAAGLCIVFALLASLMIARRITRPITTLTRAAADLALGKFDTKVNVDRQDELGTLAVAFNSMADEIQRAKANLEKSVAERTNQLNAANQDLEKQSRELSKRNQEITLFGKMNDFLHASASEAEAYSVISQAATQLFPEESGALFIISASRNMLEAAMVWGSTPPANVVFPPNECWALRRGQGHIVIDEELRCQHVADDRRMYICLPLIAHGETLGILHILNGPFGTGQAGEQHMADKYRLAKNLAENVGMAIANLKLREAMRSMSIRDPLTGLFNRRYMEEVLAQELHRAKRQVTQLAIIMIDIDHFKQFNDNFGHDGGDAILRELGIFLKKQVRASDVPCRYGGEEFILILSPTTAEGARKRAEQIREDVKLLSVSHAHQKLGTITLSLGIAFYPDHASDSEALVKAADIALYLAKQGGRDQVVVYTKKTDQTTS